MRKFVHIANGPMLRTDLIKEIYFRDDAYIAVCEDGESRQLCPGFTLSDLRDPLPVVPAIAGVTAHCFHWDDDADEKDPPDTWRTSVIAWRIHDDGPEPILLDGYVPGFIAIEDHGRFVLPNGETRGGSLTAKGVYTVDNIPAGPVKIAIYAHGHVPKGIMTKPGETAPRNAGKNAYVAIPSKYADPEKSGLTYQVKPGNQEFAIVLPP